LLVVLAIIATLGAVVGPELFRNTADAKVQAARSQIESLGLALDAYRVDFDEYPSDEEGLPALRTPPTDPERLRRWRGPYLRREVPLDPWGRPYVYLAASGRRDVGYELYSLGRDGRVGGAGDNADITSWGGAVEP
jgi:general secretion pathway protein G